MKKIFLLSLIVTSFISAHTDSEEDMYGNVAHKGNLSAEGKKGYEAGFKQREEGKKYSVPINTSKDYKDGFSLGFLHGRLAKK